MSLSSPLVPRHTVPLSDPKSFQSTILTLFTLLSLDNWALIYLDRGAQGRAGSRLTGKQGSGRVNRPYGLSYPICEVGPLRVGKEFTVQETPSLPDAWYINGSHLNLKEMNTFANCYFGCRHYNLHSAIYSTFKMNLACQNLILLF